MSGREEEGDEGLSVKVSAPSSLDESLGVLA